MFDLKKMVSLDLLNIMLTGIFFFLVLSASCTNVRPASQTTPEQFSVAYHSVYAENFESGTSSFSPRGGETVTVVSGNAYQGEYCLAITGRTATWNGPTISLGRMLSSGTMFEVEAWVKHEGPADSLRINGMLQVNNSEFIRWGMTISKKDQWTKLEGTVIIPPAASQVSLFFETPWKSAPVPEDLADIYVDSFVISEVKRTGSAVNLMPLHAIYKDYFSIGVGISPYDMNTPERAALIKRHFNSITMGNEMKPDQVLDYQQCSADPETYNVSPAIHTETIDSALQFAKENGFKVRGHTLVWHEQTPQWFFKVSYSNDPNAPLASREIMLSRMENYIKQVLDYCNETYPGIVYCFDVVNEAIAPEDGNPGSIRSTANPWYQTIGPDYVEKAFTYARKYAGPHIKLFYNDFNCFETMKLQALYELVSGLKATGSIDGIGMQGHIGIESPSLTDYQLALTRLGSLGLEIHITELDINLASNTEASLAQLGSRYKRLMTMFRFVTERGLAAITNVTVWGLSDEGSWLNNDTGIKYPLLFDRYLQPKAAFFGFALDESVPLLSS